MEKELKKVDYRSYGFIDVTDTIEKVGGIEARVQLGSKEHIGRYNGNNGVLAVIDESRRVFITEYNPNIEAHLNNCGYVKGDFYVPHSNDGGNAIRNSPNFKH